MGKIHTHYDNLKVSRMAPQEVIRAAYKALSQKYHPDKNPGDEKAARIMAILNSAYGTLSDAQRRKEHDEWIAAEEWEIEWLESTRNEERPRHEAPPQAWSDVEEPHAPRRPRQRWLWLGALALCLALGWVGGALMVAEPRQVSTMLASAWDGRLELGHAEAPPAPPLVVAPVAPARLEPRPDAVLDSWAMGKPVGADAGAVKPPVRVLAAAQVLLPPAPPDCDSEAQILTAPNGESWPSQSGYIDGFPVANKGEEMQLTLDNSGNASAVFIKLYDTERHSNVRYVYVQAHDKLLVDKLTSGKYEIRYQNVDPAAERSGCPARAHAAASPAGPAANSASN